MTPPTRVALVTGASTGIGRAASAVLLDAGFAVHATARRPETLVDLARRGARTAQLDVTDPEQAARVVRAVEAEHGAVDVLVNNAGFGQLGAVEEVPIAAWRAQFETNVFGLVRMAQLVLPAMRARGTGRIVNIGSMGGMFTTPLGAAYHASKYAVESISDALRFEVAPFGIDVVLVQPGPVATPLAERSARELAGSEGSPYRSMLDAFGAASRALVAGAPGVLAAEDVAAVIADAATAERPETRYLVGEVARAMVDARRGLDDRADDESLRPQYGLSPAPA